jgi:hypothetical protein
MSRSRRTQTSKKPDAIPWHTEFLRITAFPISGATVVPNSWKEITGNDPDEISKHPPPVQSFEAGPFSAGRLSVGYQPGRIDLILMPDQTAQSERLQLRNIGDFGLAMDDFLPAARKAFRPDMVMQRLAVGAVLLHPVESGEDGYKVLRSMLPVAREIPETASDFSLQLNVPIMLSVSGISDIRINRLLRWAVARLQLMNMVGGSSGVPTQIVSGAEMHAVRLEMDINTPADLAVPLSHQNILDVIEHLAAQARAIAANGGWFPA